MVLALQIAGVWIACAVAAVVAINIAKRHYQRTGPTPARGVDPYWEPESW